jgi:hypothetical protein
MMAGRCHCTCLLHRKGMLLRMCLKCWDCSCLLHRKGMLLRMCLLWKDCRFLLHSRCTQEFHNPPYIALQNTGNNWMPESRTRTIRDCKRHNSSGKHRIPGRPRPRAA